MMKNKFVSCLLSLSIAISHAAVMTVNAAANTVSDDFGWTEKLDRGLAAVKVSNGVYLSWRLQADEDYFFGSAGENVSFNIYRDGELIANEGNTTNYVDTYGNLSSKYYVLPVIGGQEINEEIKEVSAFSSGGNYFDIPLVLPDDETITTSSGDSSVYSFSTADCSVGDLDGDGEYEIIVKFTSNECDVGNAAYSGTVRFNAYKLDGTRLWENDINLGRNVFSSAHTAQFLVYDFDGDGKAEMTVQTSLGSTDAEGNYVSKASSDSSINTISDDENASADYREANNGRIASGLEFLTVFDGMTGAAIDTISYPTERYNLICWGKNDGGNRSQRFLADVAYLDGEKPYAVYWRGYYDYGSGRTGIAGVSFDGERLSVDYQFDTLKGQPGYHAELEDYSGQGNHSMTSADVDGDGKDEIISGALCLGADDSNELVPEWCSWREHGDAHHIGDYDPTSPGLEYFSVHEHNGESHGKTLDYGMTVYRAEDGEELFHAGNSKDTGRGMMANVGAGGYYQITGAGTYISKGGTDFEQSNISLSNNFRIFWDGDLSDELLDGTSITSWNGSRMETVFTADGCTQINGTKSNPSISADIFGDWREEVVYPLSDSSALRVFMTTDYTDYKMKSLMYDNVYRNGVAAEQTCYNQPPHIGYYLSEDCFYGKMSGISVNASEARTTYYMGEEFDASNLKVYGEYSDAEEKELEDFGVSGFNSSIGGEQYITVSYLDYTAQFAVSIISETGIEVSGKPTLEAGGGIDKADISVKLLYSDGSSKSVTDFKVSAPDNLSVGTQTLTVTYEGINETYTAEIEAEITTPFIIGGSIITGISNDSEEAVIPNCLITDGGEIISVSGSEVTADIRSQGLYLYAAKYTQEGALEKVKLFNCNEYNGVNSFDAGFEIDKAFLWTAEMRPAEMGNTVISISGIADNAFTDSSLSRIYVYNDDIEFLGDNIFPEGATIVCREESTAYMYALEHGINVEKLSEGDSITFDEDFYTAGNLLMQSDTAAELKDEFVTYHTHAADSRAPWFSADAYGFKIEKGSDGNYLSVNAGIYDEQNKFNQVYITLNNALPVSEKHTVSFDIMFPSNSGSPYVEIQNDEETVIDTVSGLTADTWYRYELSFDSGVYIRTIYDASGNVIYLDTLDVTTGNTIVSSIVFKQPFSMQSGNRAVTGTVYVDNILIN